MSAIHEEIKRLQHKASMIDYIGSLMNSETLFAPLIPVTSQEAHSEISSHVKKFLEKLSQYIEQGLSVESLLSLSPDDIVKLKLVSERLSSKVNEDTSASFANTNPKPTTAIPPTRNQRDNRFPMKATLIDTSYVSSTSGPVSGLYPDMPIWILSENNKEEFTAQLAEQPAVVFPVPKECVELKQ